MPVSSKSFVLRVARGIPFDWQIAAICASMCPIGRPARVRASTMSE
jgi:hypothetical protein